MWTEVKKTHNVERRENADPTVLDSLDSSKIAVSGFLYPVREHFCKGERNMELILLQYIIAWGTMLQ